MLCGATLLAAGTYSLRPSCWPLQRHAVNADVKAQLQRARRRGCGAVRSKALGVAAPVLGAPRKGLAAHLHTRPTPPLHTNPGRYRSGWHLAHAVACGPEEAPRMRARASVSCRACPRLALRREVAPVCISPQCQLILSVGERARAENERRLQ